MWSEYRKYYLNNLFRSYYYKNVILYFTYDENCRYVSNKKKI